MHTKKWFQDESGIQEEDYHPSFERIFGARDQQRLSETQRLQTYVPFVQFEVQSFSSLQYAHITFVPNKRKQCEQHVLLALKIINSWH